MVVVALLHFQREPALFTPKMVSYPTFVAAALLSLKRKAKSDIAILVVMSLMSKNLRREK